MQNRWQDRSASLEQKKLKFLRCKRCGRAYREETGREPCAVCGTGVETEIWPDPVGRRLFSAVEDFFKKGDHELTLILACDFLEMLVAMFFRDLFASRGRPPSWIQLTFRKNKSLDLRLRYLFKETLQVSFSSAIRGTPFEGFDKRWEKLRSVKGMTLQKRDPAVDELTAREAYELSRDALDLFAWLNNQYCL